ncbi:carboxypeptidase-like regulatory domain-containing protein [Gimesia maris]|nr:carboxypeptidase-like regulatory domain-containing protein [Gimesia maris]EDL58218.1 hypothetical protein PM8797T_23981 [Gimesia maris DSM 8797]
MMLRFTSHSLAVILFASAFTGCNSSPEGPPLETVTGTVKLDGSPLPDASILFKDPSGENKSYFASVKEGDFSTEMQPGNWKVQITARRQSKDKMVDNAEGTGKEPAMEQYLPAAYNEKSTLDINVSSGEENHFSFDLNSK